MVALENQDQWKHHAKAVKEMINASFWVFSPTPEFVFAGAIEGSEFNANRFRVNKVQAHNDWYNLLINAVKTLKKEVMARFATGITYSYNGTGSWDTLGSAEPQQTSTKPSTQSTEHKTVVQLQPTQQVTKKASLKENRQGNWYIQHFDGQNV